MPRKMQIDYLKGLAIISVILLHSMTVKQRDLIGGTYYILQAVPVFLILVGYNTVHSYLNKGFTDLRSCYEKSNMIKKFKKILVPFIYIWVLELFILIITKQFITPKILIFSFITGGWGPGGYFVTLMIQFIIIIPLLYKLARYNRYIMLISAFIINMIFELFSFYSNISGNYYRIIAFRYLFVVALGVYLALYQIKRRKLLLAGILFSLIYITSINYFGVNLPVYHAWQSQNAPSFLWPFALVIIGLKKLPSRSKTFIGRALEEIGKKSYHIFLFQALYFISLVRVTSHLKVYFAVPVNVCLCVTLGLLFYYIEDKISRYLHLSKQNNIKESIAT